MVIGEKTHILVITALMTCLITVTTMFFKIPIPFANGYVHLGDAMIFLSVLILGIKHGAIASALGSAFGDVLSGFAIWVPWTLLIKGTMALIMGLFVIVIAKKTINHKFFGTHALSAIGMFFAGVWMVFGYFIAEGIVYNNWVVAMIGVPWNIGQFTCGMIIAVAVAAALYKTPAKRYFTCRYENL